MHFQHVPYEKLSQPQVHKNLDSRLKFLHERIRLHSQSVPTMAQCVVPQSVAQVCEHEPLTVLKLIVRINFE